jgi:hypothetical protein
MKCNLTHKLPTKIIIIISILIILGFTYRAYPHLFLIPQWSPEEEYNFMTINDLITTGTTHQAGFYPIIEHLTIYGVYTFFDGHFSAITISQYFNPLLGALSAIPIFLLIKKFSNTKIALLSSLFWTFSEASFYRTAIFSSTESLSFFFAIFTLYFYHEKKYIPTIILLGLTFYTHLLPGFFIILTIFIYQFITRNIKIKILSIAIFLGVVLFLFSPLNPQQRLISTLNPVTLLSHFNLSNIFLYSGQDLILGITIFLGTIVLGILTLISFKKYKTQNTFIFSMLIASILLFVFSWITYSPQLFAPPRLTLYFIIPLSFYAGILLIKLRKSFIFISILLITIIMVSSTFPGLQPMLLYQNSVTTNEYKALGDLQQQGYMNVNPYYWWSDYPIRIALTARSPLGFGPTIEINETQIKNISLEMFNETMALDLSTSFKYIFFSERMEQESFFLIYTENRTQQIRKPISDIWQNSTIWQLIYHNYGVKVYGRT